MLEVVVESQLQTRIKIVEAVAAISAENETESLVAIKI